MDSASEFYEVQVKSLADDLGLVVPSWADLDIWEQMEWEDRYNEQIQRDKE